MLILMKQHGKMIVCCIVSVLLIGILFGMRIDGNTGLIEIAYGKAMSAREDLEPAVFVDAVKNVLARSKPEITYSYTKTVLKQAANINAMFEASDADGNKISVEVTDILDAYGGSILYESEEDKKNQKRTCDTSEFLFPTSGVYVIRVKAEDAEKRTTYSQYKLPVSGY